MAGRWYVHKSKDHHSDQWKLYKVVEQLICSDRTLLLGGSFSVRYSDSQDLNRFYIGELVKMTRVM